jgi:phosphoribosyl-AMP cyclohydrolase / phosphoribosyl-ATP pyrophosphohydrolase
MTRIEAATQLDALDFARGGGLLPVVAQHAHTGEVLMVAWANREALEQTLHEGVMCYWSRSRAEFWRKGDTSGNSQRLVALFADCDGDTVLALVVPAGPSCHTGDWSCFGGEPTVAGLDRVIAMRASAQDESPSYTRKLLSDGNLRLKKLGEEAVELALACERGNAPAVAEEAADLIYHVLVACRAAGVGAAEVLAILDNRRGRSGLRGVSAEGAAPAGGGTAPAG